LVRISDELLAKHLLEETLKTRKNYLNCVRTSAASAGSSDDLHLRSSDIVNRLAQSYESIFFFLEEDPPILSILNWRTA
jgi:hypothetical protein